ncbi:hypothetical protein MPSEU_000970800 [Mayamaea pseudoterrestris]|nr:hypothetical protein MPSEU_000970800 [Mayamaea pseudoterrestris]
MTVASFQPCNERMKERAASTYETTSLLQPIEKMPPSQAITSSLDLDKSFTSQGSAASNKNEKKIKASSHSARRQSSTKSLATISNSPSDPLQPMSHQGSSEEDLQRASVNRRQRRSSRQASSPSILFGAASGSNQLSAAAVPPPDSISTDSLQAIVSAVAAMQTTGATQDVVASSGSQQRRLRSERTSFAQESSSQRSRRASSRSRSCTSASIFETKLNLEAALSKTHDDADALGYLEATEPARDAAEATEEKVQRKNRRAPSNAKGSDDAASSRRATRTKSSADPSVAVSSSHRRSGNGHHRSRLNDAAASPNNSSSSIKREHEPMGLLDKHVSASKQRRRVASDEASFCSRESRQSSVVRHTRLRGTIRRPSTSLAALTETSSLEQSPVKNAVEQVAETNMDGNKEKKHKEKAYKKPVLDENGKPMFYEDGKLLMKVVRRVKKKSSRTSKTDEDRKDDKSSIEQKAVKKENDEEADDGSMLSMDDYELDTTQDTTKDDNVNDGSEISLEYDFESEPVPRKKKLHVASTPPVTAKGKIKSLAKKSPLPKKKEERNNIDATTLTANIGQSPSIDKRVTQSEEGEGDPEQSTNATTRRSMKRQTSLRSAFRLQKGSADNNSSTSIGSTRSMRSVGTVKSLLTSMTRNVFRKNKSKDDAVDDLSNDGRPIEA